MHVILTDSVNQLEAKTMKCKSHKNLKSNYFYIYTLGTSLVKGNAATSVVQRFDLIRSLVMKPFTDHFSFTRKTISLCLIVAFVFTNIVAVKTIATSSSNTSAFATFTTDLTQLGREGRLRQSPSFESEIDQVLEVLEKGGSRQPV